MTGTPKGEWEWSWKSETGVPWTRCGRNLCSMAVARMPLMERCSFYHELGIGLSPRSWTNGRYGWRSRAWCSTSDRCCCSSKARLWYAGPRAQSIGRAQTDFMVPTCRMCIGMRSTVWQQLACAARGVSRRRRPFLAGLGTIGLLEGDGGREAGGQRGGSAGDER